MVPDVFVDSMGYAFVLPLFRLLGGCRVACYVHYPTISRDMLERVASRESSFNNDGQVARSKVQSIGKWLYYRAFAVLYGVMGAAAEVVMVNSSWTRGHIAALWWGAGRKAVSAPRCGRPADRLRPDAPRRRSSFRRATRWRCLDCRLRAGGVTLCRWRSSGPRRITPCSFGRLRGCWSAAGPSPVPPGPGAHSFPRTQATHPEHAEDGTALVMIGGCRNQGDEGRVAALHTLRAELGLPERLVQVRTNVGYGELKVSPRRQVRPRWLSPTHARPGRARIRGRRAAHDAGRALWDRRRRVLGGRGGCSGPSVRRAPHGYRGAPQPPGDGVPRRH